MIISMSETTNHETPIYHLNPMTDEIGWIQEIKLNGSESAFAKLMKKYQDRVYWLVRRTINDHDDADEITQEVFITVYEKIHQFREESQFFTWLYRIASNKILMFLRKKKMKEMIGLDHLVELLGSKEENAEDKMIRVEWNDSLKQAIQSLPEKQRIVFNLRYYDELTYEEMSDILKTSVGGLKANYFHAVQKIKEQMENENV